MGITLSPNYKTSNQGVFHLVESLTRVQFRFAFSFLEGVGPFKVNYQTTAKSTGSGNRTDSFRCTTNGGEASCFSGAIPGMHRAHSTKAGTTNARVGLWRSGLIAQRALTRSPLTLARTV